MSLSSFLDYHMPASVSLLFHDKDLDWFMHHLSDLPVIGDVTSSPRGIAWTCLDSELQEHSLQEVESGLGLYHLTAGTPLVAITYVLDAADLRVPTVMDACLQPGFVAKAVSQRDVPRAWDWEYERWGLSEMVHRSGLPTREVEIRLLGTTSARFRPAYDGLASFSLPFSATIENVVTQVLRQVLAHRDLQPFLCGEASLLEITPIEFEQFLGLLYSRHGYQTKVTKASRDGGFDIIAFSSITRPDGLLIQAKQTRGTVGVRVVRELVGARFFAAADYAHYMLVVATTGRFSTPAKEAEAQQPTHLRLLDYEELQQQLRLIAGVGILDIVHEAVDQSRRMGTNVTASLQQTEF
jgi:hypothetical protein